MKYTVAAVVLLLPALASAQSVFDQKKFDLDSSSPAVRAAAVEYFKGQHSAAADEVLLARLEAERNPGVRAGLVEAVDVNVSTAAFSAVASLLDDPNPYVAQSAAIAMGACGDGRLLPVYEKALKGGAPAQVKQTIVNMLGFRSDPGAVALLDAVAAEKTNPSEMRRLAVTSMGRIGTKDALNKAAAYAKDKDPRVSGEAKKAAARSKKR